MRVALVSASFRTRESFDLDAHVRSLAPALARAGVSVEVFTATRGSGLAQFAQRRVEVLDHVEGAAFGVTRVEIGDAPDTARIAAGFGAFLDRERPAVCHFESLDLFGTGVIHEARVRGIATAYCARDTWPAHDRTTLTLPDLSPFELGDADAEARVLVAEELLGPLPVDGVIQGDSAAGDRLRALLHDDLTEAAEVAALRDARETIEVRRAEKRVALSAVDRRFAASRLLARQLSATVGRAFTYRAPGVDDFLLPDAPVPQKKKQSTIRFGFLGSSRPTEGAQVLLDAFAKTRARMDAPSLELTFGLERTDAARDSEIEDRAERLGATIKFHSGPGNPKAILGRVDVIVLPSLWGEFAPTSIRIALASGRPVLASNMPGVAEVAPENASVLVPPADVDALEEALLDIAKGKDTFARIRDAALSLRVDGHSDPEVDPDVGANALSHEADSSLPAVGETKTVDAEVVEWIDTYQQIAAAAQQRASADRLAHVDDIARELEGLRELSVAELFARAQEGIGRLRRAFGINDSDASLMARVVARGGVARDRTEQVTAAEAELALALDGLRVTRQAMRAEESARVRRVGDLHAVLGQYEKEALARGAEATGIAQDLATSRAERDELEGDLEKERDRGAAAAKEIKVAQGRFEGMAEEAESALTALGEAESERDLLARSVEEREDAVRALRERILGVSTPDEPQPAGLESIEAHCVALERDVETLRRHDAWLSEQTSHFVALLAPADRPDKGDPAPDGAIDGAIDGALERSSRALEQLATELAWRRGEMAAARDASESLRARLLGSPLTSRVKSWAAGPPVPDDPDDDVGVEETSGGPEDGAEDGPADAGPDVDEPKAALPSRSEADAAETITKTTTEAKSSQATEKNNR